MLKCAPQIEDIASRFHARTDFLYLGRGINYPIALEGALKLKEISYIHAEGYPAGEMKHGPIALIDERMPVVAIAPHDHVFEKMQGNIQEAKARGGAVIAITTAGDDTLWRLLDRATRLDRRGAVRCRRCWRRSSSRCRCSCSRITSPCGAAATSTSRGTWRRA